MIIDVANVILYSVESIACDIFFLHVHVQYILHTPVVSNILLQATALSGGARGRAQGVFENDGNTPKSIG